MEEKWEKKDIWNKERKVNDTNKREKRRKWMNKLQEGKKNVKKTERSE